MKWHLVNILMKYKLEGDMLLYGITDMESYCDFYREWLDVEFEIA